MVYPSEAITSEPFRNFRSIRARPEVDPAKDGFVFIRSMHKGSTTCARAANGERLPETGHPAYPARGSVFLFALRRRQRKPRLPLFLGEEFAVVLEDDPRAVAGFERGLGDVSRLRDPVTDE